MKEVTNTITTIRSASKKSSSNASAGPKARAIRMVGTTAVAEKAAITKPAVKASLGVKATTKLAIVAVKGAKNQHVIPLGNGWIVKGEKTKAITAITDNKRQAITIAMSIARSNRSGIFVHNKSGQMVSSKSFADTETKVKSPKIVASKSRRH